METEYSSYRLGLTEKRGGWLVKKSRAGKVTAEEKRRAWAGWDLPRSPWIGRGHSWGRYVGHPRPSGSHDDTHHAEGPL